jgi:hypothetical protein
MVILGIMGVFWGILWYSWVNVWTGDGVATEFTKVVLNYQNLIKMITMKINGTISRHNSSYMFKIEKCAQKQQIIIAWLGIGKLAEVMKTNIINYFSKY